MTLAHKIAHKVLPSGARLLIQAQQTQIARRLVHPVAGMRHTVEEEAAGDPNCSGDAAQMQGAILVNMSRGLPSDQSLNSETDSEIS